MNIMMKGKLLSPDLMTLPECRTNIYGKTQAVYIFRGDHVIRWNTTW